MVNQIYHQLIGLKNRPMYPCSKLQSHDINFLLSLEQHQGLNGRVGMNPRISINKRETPKVFLISLYILSYPMWTVICTFIHLSIGTWSKPRFVWNRAQMNQLWLFQLMIQPRTNSNSCMKLTWFFKLQFAMAFNEIVIQLRVEAYIPAVKEVGHWQCYLHEEPSSQGDAKW